MHVIVDGVFKSTFEQNSQREFLNKFLNSWVDSFPEDVLTVLVNDELPAMQIPGIKSYPVSKKNNLSIGKKIFGQALTSLISEQKADIYFSPSFNTVTNLKIPQVLYVSTDPAIFINGLSIPKRWLSKSALKKQFAAADKIIFSSVFTANKTGDFIPIAKEKSIVVYPAISNAGSYETNVAETKEAFTSGREYFFYGGERSGNKSVINMLKGFSAFKKRQQTNMMLMFAGTTPVTPAFQELIDTYKYRESICLTKELNRNEFMSARSAAYAAVFPALDGDAESGIIEAAADGIPVLCADIPEFRNLDLISPLYFNPDEPENVNKQMSLIFKNENKRAEMVQKCRKAAHEFSSAAEVTRYREIFRKLM